MRTLVAVILLCICLSCKSQVDSSFKQSPYISFSGRYFVFGESPFLVRKTATICLEKKLLILETGKKTSEWPLLFSNEYMDEEDVVDSYNSRDGNIIRLTYTNGVLIDVVFAREGLSYHFFITYPQSL